MGGSGSDFPVFPLRNDLQPIRGLDGPAPTVLALGLCQGDSLPLALKNVFPLQLCHCAEDGQHKLTRRGSGIDGLLLGDKLYSLGGQLLHQLQQVLGVAGEAADGLHDDHIAFADEIQHGVQLRAVGVLAADLVDVYLLCAQLLHQHFLS